MVWIIVIAIVIYIAFKIGSNSGEVVGRANSGGGMSVKYSKLLGHILGGHKDSKIIVETRTYLRAGVSNYGGTTMFHIQQCPGNKVMIDYEVSNNPVMQDFTLRFTFDDFMDQDQMMEQIVLSIQRKIM